MDENITDISDSLDFNSSYSFPVGNVTYSINNYFESLDTLGVDTLQVDTLIVSSTDSVGFNGLFFHNIKSAYDTTIVSEFDFSIMDEYTDNIRAVTIALVVTSDYPTEIRIQVYFTDASLAIMDSMYVDGPLIIPAPDIDNNGRPLERQTIVRYCPLSEDLINNLTDIRYILAYGIVRTIRPDEVVVRFYPEYMLNIHIGARVELEFSTSEL